ncbi:MAG: hypothetical protein ABW176_19825, partial [Candidatus Thiodiazotropha endolucinida]
LLLQVTGFILPTLHLEAGIGYQYSNSTIQGAQHHEQTDLSIRHSVHRGVSGGGEGDIERYI